MVDSLRHLKVWWTIINGVGSGMRLGRQVDQLFRYYVYEVLQDEGLFEYLREPRTFGQILAKFSYVDSDYTRELLNILVSDKNSVLTYQNDLYRLNPEAQLPRLEKLVSRTDKRIHGFTLMAKGMTQYIPSRLRNNPIEFSDTFEQDGRQLLTRFDRTLGSRIYSTIRNAAFALLTNDDLESLHGKSMLDVGCGSGRETAELWLKLKGNIHIVAIDPVPSLLELATKNFEDTLQQTDPAHPPLTADNTPRFELASATHLPFEDNTFDAAFHSLVLHWTPDPRKAVSEIVRVLKPGGLVFGTQGTKPHLNPYFDIVIRTNENTHGFFWKEEFLRWYGEHGVELEMITPVGIFKGHKPLTPPASGRK